MQFETLVNVILVVVILGLIVGFVLINRPEKNSEIKDFFQDL